MAQHLFLENLLNGQAVEWKTVEEIFHLKNGYTPSKSQKEYWENGTVPWFRMEDIRENGQILDDALQKVHQNAIKGGKLFPANSIIVATSATIGEHALITVPYLANQRFTNLSIKEEFFDQFDIKFVFYYCFLLCDWCKKNTTLSSFASVDMVGFKKFPFPIPPLSVQNQIVQILDAFTQLTAKLNAELDMRQKQYEYYRELLLNFDDVNSRGGENNPFFGENLVWRTLGEVTKYEQPTKYIVQSTEYCDEYEIPVLTAGKTFILGYTDETSGICSAAINPVIIFDDFTTANKWVDFDFKVKSSAMKIITSADENQFILKYIYYWLNTLPKFDNTDHKRQWISNFSNKKIPIPPLDTQAKIVAILDKFDTLTQSISDGLPREIELRQKQYEYYREILLSF